MVARRLVVTGRVQGVFFRASTRDRARDAGVAGWVRNRPDGAVEAHLEGPTDAVQAVESWMHAGPQRARVADVDAETIAPAGLTSFDVRA